MDRLILSILFCNIIAFQSCSNCEWQEEDLLFSEFELSHFDSYDLNDTIIYTSNLGEFDTIIVRGITTDNENPEIDCPIRPANYKEVTIEHYPYNYVANESWNGSAEERSEFRHIIFQMQKYLAPEETSIIVQFKNFYYVSSDFPSRFTQKDTIINNLEITEYYRLEHSYPQHLEDSTDISVVFFSLKEGLVAYQNMCGNTWVKNKR